MRLVEAFNGGDREHDVGGARNTVGVTYFRRAPCSAPDGRSRLLQQAPDSIPSSTDQSDIAINEGAAC
jgi:hypothetical protein